MVGLRSKQEAVWQKGGEPDKVEEVTWRGTQRPAQVDPRHEKEFVGSGVMGIYCRMLSKGRV